MEEELLTSPERPIVLIRKAPDSPLAPSVAPGLDTAGVMTPYTPLHHLLLDRVGRPLVMTSGNQTDEPIATGNDEALRRLSRIADCFLLHNREIVARYDDSVVRPTAEGPVFLRRARGYAPLPLTLPLASPRPLVAVGPHLKNTFTLVHGDTAYVSQHMGDLENLETLTHFRESLATYERLFRVTPELAVRDLHPGYLSTRVARELELGEPLAVQHHHAHVAAVAAEHGVSTPVIGVAYDGTGYGDDGAVWGAEILVADLTGYQRLGHLRYAPLPGGDLAARSPWRVAMGYLSLDPGARVAFREAFHGIPEKEMDVVSRQVERGLNAPVHSSMGRLFDAAAAVLGLRHHSFYEGQAAMEMETLAGDLEGPELPFPVREGSGGSFEMDPLPLLAALGERKAAGHPVAELAAAFHDAVATVTGEAARRVAEARNLRQVALGGGVFQNARLLHATARRLREVGLDVLIPRLLSPNDGAISYGQAAVATAVLRKTHWEKE
jgi:hydrogenase maturation protein HypF